MISYLQAVNVIKTFADDHLQINRFDFEFKEQMQNLATLNEAYPFLYVVPLASDTITNVNEFEVEIYCVDRLQKDRTNVNYVVSDTNQILNDLVLWLEEGQDDIEIVGTATQTPINNDLLDYVGGWVLRVRLQVEKIGLCEIPLGGEMPPPPTCENATFQNSDESFVTTIASGDTFTSDDITVNVYDQNETFLGTATNPSNVDFNVVVELDPCPPSEVNAEAINSLNEIVTTAVLTPTNNQILAPDAHLRIKKSGGANITELDLPSGSDTVETISDSVITLKDSVGTTISTTNVQATETANITAPDATIQINSFEVGTAKSNETKNFNFTTAQLMATGQTTSYATGDDGTTQRGRSKTTLLQNNLFGNTNRLTDINGLSVYGNDIVLDWATWNGQTLLGWYRIPQGSGINWATALSSANGFSASGYTWLFPNIEELRSICNYGLPSVLNYAPFNINNKIIWSGTTVYGSGNAYRIGNTGESPTIKTSTNPQQCFLACRYFTNAELGF